MSISDFAFFVKLVGFLIALFGFLKDDWKVSVFGLALINLATL